MIVATVKLRNAGRTFTDVNDAEDRSSAEARSIVKSLVAGGCVFRTAYLDRTDGMVLEGPQGAWWFHSLVCGYMGTGPDTTARVLEELGFGDYTTILNFIKYDGDTAGFTLQHPKGR